MISWFFFTNLIGSSKTFVDFLEALKLKHQFFVFIVGEGGNYHIRVHLSCIQHRDLTPYKFVASSSQMTSSKQIEVFKTTPDVQSTLESNIWVAYN